MLPHEIVRQSVPSQGFVYDLVYKPPETVLMQAARRAGLRVSNGLGMLVEQAALSLERWTGRAVPRGVMWQAIETNRGVTDPPSNLISEGNS
jgi:shikimate 5-dehydrogenase